MSAPRILNDPERLGALVKDLRFQGRIGFEDHDQQSRRKMREREQGASVLELLITPRPLAEYHEDDGPVCWWKFPVEEAAWIGKPDDDDWPGYHTHWTPHPPIPVEPKDDGA